MVLIPLQAQETNRLIIYFGGGFTTPVGSTGRVEMDGIFEAALDTTSLQLWGR